MVVGLYRDGSQRSEVRFLIVAAVFSFLVVPFLSCILCFDYAEAAAGKDDDAVSIKDPIDAVHPVYENSDGKSDAFVRQILAEREREDSKSFFTKGSAKAMWGTEADVTEAPKIQLLNARVEHEPDVSEEELMLQAAGMASGDKKLDEAKLKKLPLKERLEVKYGRPEEDPAVLAKADAPKPLQAILEALDAKDDQLAFQYARQYVRYARNLSESSKKVSQLGSYAYEREGMLPPGSTVLDPAFDGVAKMVREDIKKSTASEAKVVELDNRTKDLIARAEAVERGQVLPEPSEAYTVDEKTGRAQARAKYAHAAPVDPKGKLRVYFFFRSTEQGSVDMLSHFESLRESIDNDPNVQIILMTLDQNTIQDLLFIKKSFNVNLPLRDGYALARQLNVNRAPTTVVIADTTGKAVIEEGARNFGFIDELVKIMRGKR